MTLACMETMQIQPPTEKEIYHKQHLCNRCVTLSIEITTVSDDGNFVIAKTAFYSFREPTFCWLALKLTQMNSNVVCAI
jgi:hypothetical protein